MSCIPEHILKFHNSEHRCEFISFVLLFTVCGDDKLNVFTICVQSPLKQYVRTGFKAFMKSSRSANGVTEYDADADARAFKAYAAEALAQERSATTPPSRR